MITEEKIPGEPRRTILLSAERNGQKLWRVWREGSVSSLEKKRKLLERDIELLKP
jgi:hypothetical protein